MAPTQPSMEQVARLATNLVVCTRESRSGDFPPKILDALHVAKKLLIGSEWCGR